MTKTISPKTMQVVQRVVREAVRRRTKRSLPVKYGSASKVLINPTLAQTCAANDNDPTAAQRLRPDSKAMKESYRIYNQMVISNDESKKNKHARDGS